MPIYDCGDPECTECQLAFGPDRTKAIENYKRREAFYATLEQKQVQPPAMTRRERLIKFIEPWTKWRPRQYEPRVGMTGLGYTLKPDQLTDDALEHLASLIVRDFWRTKRSNRQNREITRARA